MGFLLAKTDEKLQYLQKETASPVTKYDHQQAEKD